MYANVTVSQCFWVCLSGQSFHHALRKNLSQMFTNFTMH